MEAPSVTSFICLALIPLPLKVQKCEQTETVQSCSSSTPGCDPVTPHKSPEWVWMDQHPKGNLCCELSCLWGGMCGFSRWHSHLGVTPRPPSAQSHGQCCRNRGATTLTPFSSELLRIQQLHFSRDTDINLSSVVVP